VTAIFITARGTGVGKTYIAASLIRHDIFYNGTGISGSGSASYGNNRVFGNTSAGSTPFTGAATTDHGPE
jgi:hypothetical protein